MNRTLQAVTLAASLTFPQAAFSQADDDTADAATAQEEAEAKIFGPADFDILLNVGFNLLYLHLEPAVDLGLIPIGGMTLGFGAGFGVGYCVLCGALTALTNADISGQYWMPYGRANLHLGSLGGLLPDDMDGWTLDPIVGLFAGPQLYTFEVKAAGGSAVEVSRTSIAFGPVLGMRLGAMNNTFLLFGEYRYGTEFGLTNVSVEAEDGSTQTFAAESLGRRGSDFILGIGLRI